MNEQTQFIRRPTDRAAWLDAIRPFIGGSEVAALCNASRFKTPIDLFLAKTGRATDDEPQDADAALRLLRGQHDESLVAEEYTRRTGRQVRNYGYIVTRGHARADVDRLVVPDGEKVASFHEEVRAAGILECKVSDSPDWDEDEPPPYYEAQVQLYMELLDLPWADIAAILTKPRFRFKLYHVERDRAIGAELLRRIEAFWTRCIVPDDAEAVTPFVRNLADARALFPRGGGEAKEADADTAARIRALRKTEADIKALTVHADKLRGEIASAMGDADALTVDGKTVCTFRAPKPTDRIDFKAAFADLALALHADAMQTASIISAHRTLVNGARRFMLKAEKPES